MHRAAATLDIWIIFSTFISRIRRSRQYTAAPAGIPPAKAGTPASHIQAIVQTSTAGSGLPGSLLLPRQASHRLI
jgi:hypothetical protein